MSEWYLPKGFTIVSCNLCTLPVVKRSGYRKPPYHTSCAIMQVAENARQQAAKSGPLYERWLKAGGNKKGGRPRTSRIPTKPGQSVPGRL